VVVAMAGGEEVAGVEVKTYQAIISRGIDPPIIIVLVSWRRDTPKRILCRASFCAYS